jgi:hypothetical protein
MDWCKMSKLTREELFEIEEDIRIHVNQRSRNQIHDHIDALEREIIHWQHFDRKAELLTENSKLRAENERLTIEIDTFEECGRSKQDVFLINDLHNKLAKYRAENADLKSVLEQTDSLRHKANALEIEAREVCAQLRADNEKTEAFYKKTFKEISEAIGIDTPLVLIARSTNNTETFADILVKLVKEVYDERNKLKELNTELKDPAVHNFLSDEASLRVQLESKDKLWRKAVVERANYKMDGVKLRNAIRELADNLLTLVEKK